MINYFIIEGILIPKDFITNIEAPRIINTKNDTWCFAIELNTRIKIPLGNNPFFLTLVGHQITKRDIVYFTRNNQKDVTKQYNKFIKWFNRKP